MRIVVVSSTGGSVMSALMQVRFFEEQIHSVVSDRKCAALDKAESRGIRTSIFPEADNRAFSDRLLGYLTDNRIDYVLSFFTRIYTGELLEVYRNRIINMHPSLLPAFPGLDSFGQAMRFGSRYCGSTIHFVGERLDEGPIILQTALPIDLSKGTGYLRHRLFQQQCKSVLQVVRWIADGMIEVKEGRVSVKGASFNDFEFSPSLDYSEAVGLDIPYPGGD